MRGECACAPSTPFPNGCSLLKNVTFPWRPRPVFACHCTYLCFEDAPIGVLNTVFRSLHRNELNPMSLCLCVADLSRRLVLRVFKTQLENVWDAFHGSKRPSGTKGSKDSPRRAMFTETRTMLNETVITAILNLSPTSNEKPNTSPIESLEAMGSYRIICNSGIVRTN